MASSEAEAISQLKALHSFLTTSFKGASINGLKVDDMAETLDKAIQVLDRASSFDRIAEVREKIERGRDDEPGSVVRNRKGY